MNMKHLFYYVVSCALLCSMLSCSDENEGENGGGNDGKVDFGSEAITNSGYGKYPHGYDGTLTKTTQDGKIAGLPDELSDKWGRGETDVWDGTVDISWYTENPDMETFFIESAEQLAGISTLSHEDFDGKTITLNVNVILNEQIEMDEDYNVLNARELKEWMPMQHFKGVFNGNGHVVSGLYIDEDKDNLGFFCNEMDEVYGADIFNLGIVNSYIRGNENISAFGGADAMNCFSTAVVIGESNVAGIAFGISSLCFNKGIVIAYSGAAYGITDGSTEYCYNAGIVKDFMGESYLLGGRGDGYNLYVPEDGSSAFLEEGVNDGSTRIYCFTVYSPNIMSSKNSPKELITFDDEGNLSHSIEGYDDEVCSTLMEALNSGRKMWFVDLEKNNGFPILIEDFCYNMEDYID